MPPTNRTPAVPPSLPAGVRATISGAYARLLLDWLRRERVNAAALTAALSRVRLQERVPLTRWHAWLEQAAAHRASADFALGIGALTDHRHLGLLAHLARCTPTLESALQDYLRFEGLQYGMVWARLIDKPDGIGLRWQPAPGKVWPLVEIVALSSFFAYAAGRLGMRHAFREIAFSLPAPADSAPYARFFGCPVVFGRPYAQLLFHREALSAPVGRDAALREHLHSASQRTLDLTEPANALVGELLDFIQDRLPEGGALLPRFAGERGITPRAIQKRLAAVGQDFRRLQNGVRQNAAVYFLADESLTLAEVAFLLGYSEQSAFQHAFRGWFGVTPRAWRQTHGAGEP